MIRTDFPASHGVVGQSRYWRRELFGQPDEQRAGQMRAIEPALTGVTKQRDVEGQSEPIGSATVSVGIPSKVSRTDRGRRRRDAMACLQKDGSHFGTAWSIETIKETSLTLGMGKS